MLWLLIGFILQHWFDFALSFVNDMLTFYFCFLQDEVDSLSPVLRDYPHLHEEVKAWVKDQKVQEIFMQGNVGHISSIILKGQFELKQTFYIYIYIASILCAHHPAFLC